LRICCVLATVWLRWIQEILKLLKGTRALACDCGSLCNAFGVRNVFVAAPHGVGVENGSARQYTLRDIDFGKRPGDGGRRVLVSLPRSGYIP